MKLKYNGITSLKVRAQFLSISDRFLYRETREQAELAAGDKQEQPEQSKAFRSAWQDQGGGQWGQQDHQRPGKSAQSLGYGQNFYDWLA